MVVASAAPTMPKAGISNRLRVKFTANMPMASAKSTPTNPRALWPQQATDEQNDAKLKEPGKKLSAEGQSHVE